MLVSTALNIDSAKTKEFACKVVIISSFRFPNYRKRLLTMLGYLIPSRYHVDTSLVDIVEYRVPERILFALSMKNSYRLLMILILRFWMEMLAMVVYRVCLEIAMNA